MSDMEICIAGSTIRQMHELLGRRENVVHSKLMVPSDLLSGVLLFLAMPLIDETITLLLISQPSLPYFVTAFPFAKIL